MDSLLDSIVDGRKGDVLTLLGLCMLTECHVLVHLKGGKMWTSLQEVPSSHTLILKQVNLQLVYLGLGNFAKLSKCKMPLQVLPCAMGDKMTVVVRMMITLSPDEKKL